MITAFKSDKGRVREINEDSIFASVKEGFFLLADGMGGREAGEIASRLAIHQARSHLEKNLAKIQDDKAISKILVEAIFKAHDKIIAESRLKPSLSGMGTTLVELAILNGKAWICNVGDSRVYLIRDIISQITDDQTFGNYLVKNKIMTQEQVPPKKWHVLTQAVGVVGDIVPDIFHVSVQADDCLLLCSDGLTNMLKDVEIKDFIDNNRNDLEKAVTVLIEEANKKGGKDNISVILVKVT